MLALLRRKRIPTSDILKSPTFLSRKNIYAGLILQRGSRSAADNNSARSILTLDPAKLQSKPQKIHDISLTKILLVRLRTIGGPTSARFRFQATKDADNVTQDIPFPAHSRGVFYYHVDPQLPPISGGIRFRLCDSLDTFDQGEDLHITTGKPWNISLLRIARTDGFKGLVRFLIKEGLVEKDLIQDLRQLDAPSRFVGLYLYHLSQPLIIDLETTALTVHLTTRKTFSSTLLYSPFYNSFKARKPYSGLAKVRFELSPWQEHEKNGPTLILRILEFLSPVRRVLPPDSGPYIEPFPDTFAMRRTVGGILKPWAYPLGARSEGAKWEEFLAASRS